MNEQTTPQSPDEPTTQMPEAAQPAAEQPAAQPQPSNAPTRNKLIVGGGVIAVVCSLVGYQLGSNSNNDQVSDRFGPGPGKGQGQFGPPGMGPGQGPGEDGQRQQWQGQQGAPGPRDDDSDDKGDDKEQGGQTRPAPPMSGAS